MDDVWPVLSIGKQHQRGKQRALGLVSWLLPLVSPFWGAQTWWEPLRTCLCETVRSLCADMKARTHLKTTRSLTGVRKARSLGRGCAWGAPPRISAGRRTWGGGRSDRSHDAVQWEWLAPWPRASRTAGNQQQQQKNALRGAKTGADGTGHPRQDVPPVSPSWRNSPQRDRRTARGQSGGRRVRLFRRGRWPGCPALALGLLCPKSRCCPRVAGGQGPNGAQQPDPKALQVVPKHEQRRAVRAGRTADPGWMVGGGV